MARNLVSDPEFMEVLALGEVFNVRTVPDQVQTEVFHMFRSQRGKVRERSLFSSEYTVRHISACVEHRF